MSTRMPEFLSTPYATTCANSPHFWWAVVVPARSNLALFPGSLLKNRGGESLGPRLDPTNTTMDHFRYQYWKWHALGLINWVWNKTKSCTMSRIWFCFFLNSGYMKSGIQNLWWVVCLKTMSQLGLPGPEPVPQSVEIVVWVALPHDAAALPLCFTLTGVTIFVSSVYFCVSLLAIRSGHCHLECVRVHVSMYICISMQIIWVRVSEWWPMECIVS